MAGVFGEFFLVSVSHETKHEKSSKNSGKIRSKIRGKIRDKNSKNSGNFRSATFLTLFLHVLVLCHLKVIPQTKKPPAIFCAKPRPEDLGDEILHFHPHLPA